MEFTFNEEQVAVAEVARGLFEAGATPARVAEVESGEERIDRRLWAAMAGADLLGLALPEDHGGAGLGILELGLLLRAQGRCVAPVPAWATLVLGALPIARFGAPEVRARWLPGVVAGEVLLSAALSSAALGVPGVDAEMGEGGSPGEPAGTVTLTGSVAAVPQGHVAERILVPATTPAGGTVVALVDPETPGAHLERAVTTNREIHPHLTLEGVVAERLVGPDRGAEALRWMLLVAWTCLAALALGVAEAALEQTAAHLNQREQFGRPLATFQGAMLRAADAAIDIDAMAVTLWQAAWRLDTDREAADAVAVAIWQASERGQRVVHATQHLHGGIGADIAYPVHRTFLWNKQIECLLGSPSVHLARLGDSIAEQALLRAGARP